MLVFFEIASSMMLLVLVAFIVLTRVIYRIRKCSGLSVLIFGIALVVLSVLQIRMIDTPIYAQVFAVQNIIIAVAMLLLSIFLWVMTLIDRRVFKWDGISYGPSICLLVMIPLFYFVGVVAMSMAAMN